MNVWVQKKRCVCVSEPPAYWWLRFHRYLCNPTADQRIRRQWETSVIQQCLELHLLSMVCPDVSFMNSYLTLLCTLIHDLILKGWSNFAQSECYLFTNTQQTPHLNIDDLFFKSQPRSAAYVTLNIRGNLTCTHPQQLQDDVCSHHQMAVLSLLQKPVRPVWTRTVTTSASRLVLCDKVHEHQNYSADAPCWCFLFSLRRACLFTDGKKFVLLPH